MGRCISSSLLHTGVHAQEAVAEVEDPFGFVRGELRRNLIETAAGVGDDPGIDEGVGGHAGAFGQLGDQEGAAVGQFAQDGPARGAAQGGLNGGKGQTGACGHGRGTVQERIVGGKRGAEQGFCDAARLVKTGD